MLAIPFLTLLITDYIGTLNYGAGQQLEHYFTTKVSAFNTVSYILVNLFIVVSLGVNNHTRINQFHAIVSKFTIYAFITIISTE